MHAAAEPAFCVIDVGTGGIKCLVFDRWGAVLFKESSPIQFRFDGPAIDFDPQTEWNTISILTRHAVAACSRNNFRIVTVASTSMREGNVFYDAEGSELLAVPNLDARAYTETKFLEEKFGEEIYAVSGHWPSAIFAITRLKWLEKNRELLFEKIKKVSMINDWVLYRFSGKMASEPTNACETALFDVKKRDWSDSLIKDAGLERSVFPKVQECGTSMGEVTQDARNATCLDPATQVIVGAADTEAAVAGCGLFDFGEVAAIAGTTTPVQAVMDMPLIDRSFRTWTCCHVIPHRWTLESNAGATGLVFKWWAEMTGRDFAFLDSEVLQEEGNVQMGRVKLGIGTNLMNARHPHPLTGKIEGVSPWTPRADITHAILETNCFSVRANLEQLENVLDHTLDKLHFCGGASKSALWTQMQCDVLKLPLITIGTGEATGRGAAMLSGVGSREFRDLEQAEESFLGEKKVYSPRSALAAHYEERYRTWRNEIDK